MIENATVSATSPSPLDAGLLREELFQELLSWGGAGAALDPRTERFYARLRTLSILTGIPVATLLTDLRVELEGLS